jgi:hypothetical protein
MSAPIKVFSKDPSAVLNYTIDWSKWLASDTISTSIWTPDTGITVNSNTKTSTTTTVLLSGGTLGTDYNVVNRIVTAAGLTDERTISIQVREQ